MQFWVSGCVASLISPCTISEGLRRQLCLCSHSRIPKIGIPGYPDGQCPFNRRSKAFPNTQNDEGVSKVALVFQIKYSSGLFVCFFPAHWDIPVCTPPEAPFGAEKHFLQFPPFGLDQAYLGAPSRQAVAELLWPALGDLVQGAVSLGGRMSSSERSAFCLGLLVAGRTQREL